MYSGDGEYNYIRSINKIYRDITIITDITNNRLTGKKWTWKISPAKTNRPTGLRNQLLLILGHHPSFEKNATQKDSIGLAGFEKPRGGRGSPGGEGNLGENHATCTTIPPAITTNEKVL